MGEKYIFVIHYSNFYLNINVKLFVRCTLCDYTEIGMRTKDSSFHKILIHNHVFGRRGDVKGIY